MLSTNINGFLVVFLAAGGSPKATQNQENIPKLQRQVNQTNPGWFGGCYCNAASRRIQAHNIMWCPHSMQRISSNFPPNSFVSMSCVPPPLASQVGDIRGATVLQAALVAADGWGGGWRGGGRGWLATRGGLVGSMPHYPQSAQSAICIANVRSKFTYNSSM